MFIKKDFVVLQPLGSGIFYKNYVTKVKKKFYETRTMKKAQIINLFLQDLVLHEKSKPRHNYLVNTVFTFQDYDTLFLVSELPQCGYLYYYLRKYKVFGKKTASFFIAQIITAIRFLHSKNYIYRMLSPDNIMITSTGNIKLRFDFCNMLGMTEIEYRKNIEYIPIDYYKEEITKVSDYWSIGIILYEFVYGYTPFNDNNWENILNNVKTKKIVYKENDESTPLLKGLLERFTFRRIGNNEKDIKKIKKMEFFDMVNWQEIESGNCVSPFKNYKPVDFSGKGKELTVMFDSDLKKREGDGYGSTFNAYSQPESQIDYYMDLN